MDKLPEELIIDNLIKMSENDIYNFKMTNKRIYSIYKHNLSYIYTQKIKNEFHCIENPRDLYLILNRSPDQIELICKKNFKRIIKCKDIKKYMTEIMDILNSRKRYGITINIQLVIELYNNIINCFDLNKDIFYNINLIKTIKIKLDEYNNQIHKIINKNNKISSEVQLKWIDFYQTKLKKFIIRLGERINQIESKSG